MLRLLREKGLQTLLAGDTLEERNDGGQALLRLARLGTDENAKASEGQDERTEYEPLFRKGGLPTKEIISQGNKRENPNYQEKD